MICRHCCNKIPDKSEICPVCRNRQIYTLGGISAEEQDLFRIGYAEKSGRGYDVSAQRRELVSQRKNGWSCPLGSFSGLYVPPQPIDPRRLQTVHLYWAGGALIDGRNVYIPSAQYPLAGKNGLHVFERDRFDEFIGEFIPLEGTPMPNAVLFGEFVVLPVSLPSESGFRFAVINARARRFVGYLSSPSGEPFKIQGMLPRLIVDDGQCLLFIAAETRLYGFRFTGSKCFVPFREDGALGTDYLNGSGKLSDVIYADGKFFFALNCAREERNKWRIAMAELVQEEGKGVRLRPRTFPLYAGQSVLRMFTYGGMLYWLSLLEGALVLFSCGTQPQTAHLVPLTMEKEVLLPACRFLNTVDLVEFDGASLTVYGHDGDDERYIRRVRARIAENRVKEASPEESVPQEPFCFKRVGEELVPCPRVCASNSNTAALIEGNTVVKLR